MQGARNYGPVCAEPGFHPVSRQREDGEGGPTMKLEEAIAKAKILNDSLKELTDEYEGQGSFIAAGMAVSFKLVLDTILTALRPVSKEQVEKVWRGEWNYSHTTETDHFAVVKCSKCGHEAFAIALYVKDEKQKLQVFQRGSVYLATKKIGKRNPKAPEIEADNRKRQEWNRAVDMALISGIPEPQIMEVKQKRISEPIKSAISWKGRKPNLFAKVVTMAIEALELMIESVLVKKYKESLEQKEELQKTDASEMQTVMPETERTEEEINEPVERLPEPKQPEMTRMASKYPRFYKIYNELEQQNNAIYKKEKQRSAKKKELSEIKGWFKGRKKKELQEEIDDMASQIRNMKDYLPKIVQKVGYRSIQEFLKDFKTAKSEHSQYQKAIAQWQQETVKEPEPQPHGVRAKLAANRKKIEQEQKNTQRTRSQNQDRGVR